MAGPVVLPLTPIHFAAHRWPSGALGALRMGASPGGYCLGCCWAIMLPLVRGGVRHLRVAAIAFFVLLETVLQLGGVPSWVAGAGMLIAGVVLFASRAA